jgi:hypothetical protein
MAKQTINIGSGELAGNGESIRSAFSKVNDNFDELYTNGGVAGVTGPQGPSGADGAVGPTGPSGADGAAGPTGPEGVQGAVGPTGPAGTGGTSISTGDTAPLTPELGDLWYDTVSGRMYVYYDSGWVDANPSAVGPAGPQGVAGSNGAVGPTGPQGVAGPTGPEGIANLGDFTITDSTLGITSGSEIFIDPGDGGSVKVGPLRIADNTNQYEIRSNDPGVSVKLSSANSVDLEGLTGVNIYGGTNGFGILLSAAQGEVVFNGAGGKGGDVFLTAGPGGFGDTNGQGGDILIHAGYGSELGGDVFIQGGEQGQFPNTTYGYVWINDYKMPSTFGQVGQALTIGTTASTTASLIWSNIPSFSAVAEHVLPAADLTYDLGSTSSQWRSLYVGTSTVYFGGTALSITPTGSLTINGNPIGNELVSPTVPTVGGTASAGEAGITYLTNALSKWAIFTEGAFTVGVWTDVQPGWTVTDNNGFTDTIAGRGSFGAASFQTTVNDWPSPASGKTYVFTSPDYQLGYTNPIEITVGDNDWTFGNDGDLTAPGDIVVGGEGGGHFVIDATEGYNTSVRWYNMPVDSNQSLIRAYTGNPDEETELNRGRIQLAWQDENRSGMRIVSYDRTDEENSITRNWTFTGYGSLELPEGGTIVEGIVTDNPTIELIPADPDVESQKLVIKGGVFEELDDYHLHLTTGDLTETSIILGTDEHNVRTSVDGSVEINSRDYSNTASNTWRFSSSGEIYLPPSDPDNFFSGQIYASGTGTGFLNLNIQGSANEEDYGGVRLGNQDEKPVELWAGLNTIFRFDSDGSLTFPNGSTSTGATVFANSSSYKIQTISFDGSPSNVVSTYEFGIARMTIPSNGYIFNEGQEGYWALDGVNSRLQFPNLARIGYGLDESLPTEDDLKIFASNTGSVYISANGEDWKFGNDGDLTLPAGGDIVDSTGVSQTAQRVEDTWTVTTGTNTYSFTVPSDGTYIMWVKGNIPNGIITWNATVSVTNSNVPAIGTQYAWNYTGGGSPILLTAIPDQIVGTAGTISTDATYAGTTSNRFDFTIANTSGESQTVYYGYTKI